MNEKTRLAKIAELIRKIADLRIQLALKSQPQALQPLLRRKAEDLIVKMEGWGYKVMVHQGFRSIAEQDYLYAQGRTRGGSVVTNAKGGESLHNYGVAFDMVFISDGKPSWDNRFPWDLLGRAGQELGLEWGGAWKTFVDRPHFQMLQGYTLGDFQNKRVDYKKFN